MPSKHVITTSHLDGSLHGQTPSPMPTANLLWVASTGKSIVSPADLLAALHSEPHAVREHAQTENANQCQR